MSLKKDCYIHYKSLAKAYMTRNVYWMKNIIIGIVHARVATAKSSKTKAGREFSNILIPGIDLRVIKTNDGIGFKIERLECSSIKWTGKLFDEGSFFCIVERYIHDLPSSIIFSMTWEIISKWQPRRDYTWAIKNEVMTFGRICTSGSDKERVVQTSLPIAEKSEEVAAPQQEASEGVVSQLSLTEANREKRMFDSVREGVLHGDKIALAMMQAYLDEKKKEWK
jgi:hypothetical protein